MKKILLPCFLFFLFSFVLIRPAHTLAALDKYGNEQDCNTNTMALAGGINVPLIPCQEYQGYTLDPKRINDNVFIETVTIQDVPVRPGDVKDGPKKDEYYVCLKTNPRDCGKDDLYSTKGVNEYFNLGNIPIVEESKPDPNTGRVSFTFKVCGDGGKTLKIFSDGKYCKDDGSDWFHPGSTYRITLFDRQDPKSSIIRMASFYVYHFYPTPSVFTSKTSSITVPIFGSIPIPLPGQKLDSLNSDEIQKAGGKDFLVKLSGASRRGKGDSSQYNDYYLYIEGYDTDYSNQADHHKCIFVPPQSSGSSATSTGQGTVTFNYTETGNDGTIYTLNPGVYILKIVDGTGGDYGGYFNSLTGQPPGAGFNAENVHCGEGNFTYWAIPFTVAQGYSDAAQTKPIPGDIGAPVMDPNGKEVGVTFQNPTPAPICDNAHKKNGYCTSVPTAIGLIHTSPSELIRDVFTIVLSIGGIAAVTFFIRAGYTLMTSGGNKEKVGQAREQITSAITGLIFIILSITILEFIGINILHIPGLK